MQVSELKNASIVVVFRNDDPSANMNLEHEARIFSLFDRYRIPQTIGVVPYVTNGDRHSRKESSCRSILENVAALEFLRNAVVTTGSEIALHGFTHQTNRLSKPWRRDYFEFQRLPLSEQRSMLERGTRILEEAFGCQISTFIPPWNRHDSNTLIACGDLGYRVISAAAHSECGEALVGFGTNTGLAGFHRAYEDAKKSEERVFIHVLFHSATVTSEGEIELLEDILRIVSADPSCFVGTIRDVVGSFEAEVRLLNLAGKNVVPLAAVNDGRRSRVWPYLKLFSVILKRMPLDSRMKAAAHLYWTGRYGSSVREGEAIDRICRRLLIVFRAAVFLIGLLLMILFLGIPRYGYREIGLYPIIFLWILLLALGIYGRRAASAVQTGNEILISSAMMILGMAFCFVCHGFLVGFSG